MAIDLAQIVESAFGSIRSSVKDLVKTVVFTRVSGEPVYDPIAGSYTPTESTKIVSAVVTNFKSQDFDWTDVRLDDLKLLVPYSLLGYIPSSDDRVSIGGVSYQIVSVKPDPTQTALVRLQVRR